MRLVRTLVRTRAIGTRCIDAGYGGVRAAPVRLGVCLLSIAVVLAAITASAATTSASTAAALCASLAGLTRTLRLGTIAVLVARRPVGAFPTTFAATGIAARPVGTRSIGTRPFGARSIGTRSIGARPVNTRFRATRVAATIIAIVATVAARPAVPAGLAGTFARRSVPGRLAPRLAVTISAPVARPIPLAETIRASLAMCRALARRRRCCRRWLAARRGRGRRTE